MEKPQVLMTRLPAERHHLTTLSLPAVEFLAPAPTHGLVYTTGVVEREVLQAEGTQTFKETLVAAPIITEVARGIGAVAGVPARRMVEEIRCPYVVTNGEGTARLREAVAEAVVVISATARMVLVREILLAPEAVDRGDMPQSRIHQAS